MIQMFGVQAVYGRVLSVREMRRMALAKRIDDAAQERAASGDWAEWAEKNPDKSKLLNSAARCDHAD